MIACLEKPTFRSSLEWTLNTSLLYFLTLVLLNTDISSLKTIYSSWLLIRICTVTHAASQFIIPYKGPSFEHKTIVRFYKRKVGRVGLTLLPPMFLVLKMSSVYHICYIIYSNTLQNTFTMSEKKNTTNRGEDCS